MTTHVNFDVDDEGSVYTVYVDVATGAITRATRRADGEDADYLRARGVDLKTTAVRTVPPSVLAIVRARMAKHGHAWAQQLRRENER